MNDAPQELLLKALQQDESDDLEGAAKTVAQLLERFPEAPQALCLMGRVQRRKGNLAQAREYLMQARQQTPDAYQLLSELGTLELEQGNANEAIAYFRRMVSLMPDRSDAHYNLAKSYQIGRAFEPALEHFRRALDLGIDRPHEIYTDIGSVLVMQDEYEEASEHFTKALVLEPKDVSAVFGLGAIHAAHGDFDQACERYRQCIDMDRDFAPAYRQLAEEKKFESYDDEDLKLLEAMLATLSLKPLTREKLHFALGKAHDDLAAYDTAFRHYEEANKLKKARQRPFDRGVFAAYVDRVIALFDTGIPQLEDGIDESGTPHPVCVIGLPRSGTTLVEQILSRHAQVSRAGEIDVADRISRSLLRSYELPLSEVGPAEWNEARSTYLQRLRRDAADASYVTDKAPGNAAHVGLIKIMFPGARLIHCHRNLLDTAVSNFFQDFSVDNYPAYDMSDLVFYFEQYGRLMDHWKRVLPGAVLTVNYEDLIAEQETVTRDMLAHCGLSWDPNCLDFSIDDRAVSTISRWQVRQPLYKKLGRAVEKLSPPHHALCRGIRRELSCRDFGGTI